MDQPVLTRFYLNIRNSVFIEDPDGSELPDLAAARAFALEAARDLWAAAIIEGQDLCDDQFEIMNEAGDCLALVPFVDALPDRMKMRLGLGGASAKLAFG
jgi:hypothetical protein